MAGGGTADGTHRPGERLKLLHVIHTLDPAGGGAVSAARSMCAALAARGHDVSLYATGPEPADRQDGYRSRIFPMEFKPMAVSSKLLTALRQKTDVDLVHIHMLYRFPQTAAAWVCRRNRIPYCVQPHGALEPVLYHKRERRTAKRLYESLIENRNLKDAAGLIYTAEGEKQAVDFLKLRAPAFVVPLGVGLPPAEPPQGLFRLRHGLEDKELIVWMGRMVPVKGLDILMRAFAGLARRRPRAVLVLAGPDTGNLAGGLRQLMAELGLAPGRVIFTGMLEGEQKWAVLKDADLFLLPSHTENFALAAVEAMAMGCPVIVSQGVKIAPDIAAAGAGLVAAAEPAALESAINRLLDDGGLRATMGAAARIFAHRLDWPQVIGRLEEAYRAMIAE
ncbi:MAG TPA: glycosyltransferase [Rhizomicrobium sp.]|nr:glycosyltransferase [Rhizomicrobium sp.]